MYREKVSPNRRRGWRSAVCCALAVGLLTLVTSCGPDVSADDRLDSARGYQEEGRYRAAIIELRNALQKEPNNAQARARLGQAYLATDDVAAAEKELSRALELGAEREALVGDLGTALLDLGRPRAVLDRIEAREHWPAATRARIAALRGRAHVAEGDYPQARAALRLADELHSGVLETYLGRMDLALAQGQITNAGRYAERASSMHPESMRAWRERARVALLAGETQLAQEAITHAIGLGARRSDDYLLRARLHTARGNAAAARADLDQIGRRTRSSPQALFVESLVLAIEGDQEAACGNLSQAVAAAPEYVEARFHLSACHFRSGQFNQAESHLRWVNQRSPAPQVAGLLGATQYELGDLERARSTLRPVVQQYPDNVNVRALLGRIETELGNTDVGLEHLRRLVELRPDDPAIRLQLGVGLLQAGADTGPDVFGEVLDLDPDFAQAGELLVVSLVRTGEYIRAIEEAERLADRRPGEALPLNLLALIHFGRGDRPAATAALERAIEREPGDPSARHNLARLALVANEPAVARGHYSVVLGESSDHVETLLALAEVEQREGAIDHALALRQHAHEVDRDDPETRAVLADHYLDHAAPAAALAVLTGADGAMATAPELRERAARAHLALGDPDAASADLEAILQDHPRAPTAHLLLARAYAAQGRSDEAIAQIERLLEFVPDHPQGLMLQARVHQRAGEGDRAEAALERLPPAFREHSFALETRAAIAEHRGEHAAAADYYGRAHAQAPATATVVRWSKALRNAQRPDQALTALEEWLAEHPAALGAHLAVGDLHTWAARERSAIAAYRAALEIDPDSVRALNNLAWHLRERDSDAAVGFARRALVLAPESATVRDTLGVVLLHDGQVEAAIYHLQRAHERSPDAPNLGYHLARALVADERPAEARAHLRRVLASGNAFAQRADAEALLAVLDSNP